jgi:hypothetical protein
MLSVVDEYMCEGIDCMSSGENFQVLKMELHHHEKW